MSLISSIKVRRSIIVAVAVIICSIIVFRKFSKPAAKSPALSSFQSVNVLTNTVQNKDIPLNISLSGKLVARNRIDLYAEVSGVLLSNNFREGNSYAKGSVVARIDDRELQATIKSQKSAFMNGVAQLLPDLGIDFPTAFETWKAYHKNISFDKKLSQLPDIQNEQLKLFLSSRGIFTNYYLVKSQEERLAKYTITSPFSAVLSSADISSGALVRVGQKMGTLIEPGTYELEASASIDDLRYFKVGDKVNLTSDEMDGKWVGSILRINRSMDPSTQMVRVYIGVNGNTLREGQYMNANIHGATLKGVFEVSRQFLLDREYLYFIESDSVLTKKKVDLAYQGVETSFVKNIPDGKVYLNQVLSSGYEGMIVKPLSNNKK